MTIVMTAASLLWIITLGKYCMLKKHLLQTQLSKTSTLGDKWNISLEIQTPEECLNLSFTIILDYGVFCILVVRGKFVSIWHNTEEKKKVNASL